MGDTPSLPVYGFEPNLGGLVGLVFTVLLPVLVGLVTTKRVSPVLKGVLLLFLTAVKVVVEGWLEARNTGVSFEMIPLVYSTAMNFVVAVLVYLGLYKPETVTGKSIANWAQSHGLTSKE